MGGNKPLTYQANHQPDDQQTRERVARTEALLLQLESLADPRARTTAIEAVQALLDLYGEGLARMVAAVSHEGTLPRAFAEDELIAHLLLLHGLHPHDTATRVRDALRAARPHLITLGGDAELLGIEGQVVRLRLVGSGGSGTAPNHALLRDTVEQLVLSAAPEVTRVEMEGAGRAPLSAGGSFIPLGNLIEVDGDG